jgi:hypothetical protein
MEMNPAGAMGLLLLLLLLLEFVESMRTVVVSSIVDSSWRPIVAGCGVNEIE